MTRIGSLLVLATLAVGLVPVAQAAGVYRCEVDGVPTFVNKAIKGKTCKKMAHAPPPPSRPHVPVPKALAVGGHQVGPVPGTPDMSMPAGKPGGLPPLPPMSLPPETLPPAR